MARLRPGRTCRTPNSQAWARYSQSKPRKNYIRALPHTSIQIFDMGKDKDEYTTKLLLETQQPIQLRSNALEAARRVANQHLEADIPLSYYLKLLVYPHNVIREHKMAAGAGADRVSRGMSLAFGRPISVAARLRRNQAVLMIKTKSENKEAAINALKRAAAKLSGTYKVRLEVAA
jgi:large subunit ribosomal protein L10e